MLAFACNVFLLIFLSTIRGLKTDAFFKTLQRRTLQQILRRLATQHRKAIDRTTAQKRQRQFKTVDRQSSPESLVQDAKSGKCQRIKNPLASVAATRFLNKDLKLRLVRREVKVLLVIRRFCFYVFV